MIAAKCAGAVYGVSYSTLRNPVLIHNSERDPITAIKFNKDGKQISAARNSGTLTIVDLVSLKVLRNLYMSRKINCI